MTRLPSTHDLFAELGPDLLSVEKPARYLGGELGSHARADPGDGRLSLALCFPDLYEIGMSNNAIRILYNDIGQMADRLICERVFAPARDFEALLRRRRIPLCSLESGIALGDFDLVGFSLGYELLATNVLTVLSLGGIPLEAEERGEGAPIVLAGGPAATNPLPLAAFLDAVYVGEAEAGFYDLLGDLARLKAEGKGRAELLARLGSSPSIWLPPRRGRAAKPASRAVFSGFSARKATTYAPLPLLQTVQSHGTTEIMRGCPNGCRFCHAGFYYRPQRVKDPAVIGAEVADLVERGGYREITLSSLSSGDYPDIGGLFKALNAAWADRKVSFQLPSLKVDSFTLPLVAELAEVRKSGLTFAVETPVEGWQRGINKRVEFDKVAGILKEAKRFGFRSAKFYFMIGLPVPGRGRGEGEAIVDFLRRIAAVERIAINVNIGTFVPKPHTPYQREAQIGEREALDTLYFIKDSLRPIKSVSISYHSPYTSSLEGLLARGDERAGDIILRAWEKGARFDAWDDQLDKKAWDEAAAESGAALGYDPKAEFLGEREAGKALPWDSLRLFVSPSYLATEASRSVEQVETSPCSEDCDHPCGSCNESFGIVSKSATTEVPIVPRTPALRGFELGRASSDSLEDRRLVIVYSRAGAASLLPLHAFPEIFARAFTMLGLPARYTEGFNPLPRMELNQPLSLGVQSEEELVALWLDRDMRITDEAEFLGAFRESLPSGIRVRSLRLGLRRSQGRNSIGSLYYGSEYEVSFRSAEALGKAESAAGRLGIGFNRLGASSAAILLKDAKGGEPSISKFLSAVFAPGSFHAHCSATRTRLLGRKDEGPVVPLSELL